MILITDEIRQMFLNFFYEKQHKILPGSSLIPTNDVSLLFTNAGMNQFKDIFLGNTHHFKYKRAATTQFCLRTGGKHNDFENVGYTTKHHTFFEMLGNFSFGDYFKLESILYSWEFLTSKKWLNLSKNKLWVTVYENDIETYEIWKNKIKINEKKIIKIKNKKTNYDSENFWTMGETGPCGPSTEIFYDHGLNFAGYPPNNKNLTQGIRFVEIWNIVFIQFNKINNSTLIKLPTIFVDTGMGLERISAIVQNKISNYEIDIFNPLIQHIINISNLNSTEYKHKSLYVIADHIRACSFLISENITPSNEKQGYVLRRIIRRTIRHGHKIGINSLFLHTLLPILIESTGKIGIILENKKNHIEKILKLEESKFIITFKKGLSLFEKKIKNLKDNSLSGKEIFKLYDTFGLPLDSIKKICRERNIKINNSEIKNYFNKQKHKNHNTFIKKTKKTYSIPIKKNISTIFSGYKINQITSTINNIIIDDLETNKIVKNQTGIIFLKITPFFSESGGQIGDSGFLFNDTGKFLVNCTKNFGNYIGHIGTLLSGSLKIADKITAIINFSRRKRIQINHSTTHLLHATLRKILGMHVFQKGSFISDTCLKFDFSHDKPIDLNEIYQIEKKINEKVCENLLIKQHLTTLEEAKKINAIALFQKKYNNIVRVITINNFSIEVCKGTHTKRTGDIGFFKIIGNKSISSGIRRIEAVTGEIALSKNHNLELEIKELSDILQTKPNNLKNKIKNLISKINFLEKKTELLNNYKINNIVDKLIKQCIIIKNVKIVLKILKNQDTKSLRNIIDKLKSKIEPSIIIISSIINHKAIIIVSITKNLSNKISANELLHILIKNLNGKGGGKKYIAEGGIKNIINLPKELKNIIKWIELNL